ncbi:MAG: TolC family protein [Myxococcales bacterium]|nr:TolC family protein [Myxococcales bacterium]
MRALVVAAALAGCYSPPSARPVTPTEVDAWTAGRAAAKTGAAPASWDMDVEAALAYAAEHGSAAQAGRDAEGIARAEVGAAGQLSNPELRVGKTFDGSEAASDRIFVALRLKPDMPWARSAAIAGARANAAAEKARTAIAVRDAAKEIRRIYASLAFGEASRDVIVKQLGVLSKRRDVLAAQVARSAATQLELILAEEDLVDLESKRGELEVELTHARGVLAELVGIPQGQTWRPTWDLATLRTVETTFDRAALAQKALASRPELAEAAHKIQEADALAYRERALRVPWLEYVQVERSTRDAVDWAVSLGISVPLLSLNGGEIEAADARTHAAHAERRRLAVGTLRALDAAIAYAETTGKRARDLADRLAPLDKALTDLLAQPGAATVTDPVKLLLLEERHVRAERAVLAAALEHRLAVIEIESLAGGAAWR